MEKNFEDLEARATAKAPVERADRQKQEQLGAGRAGSLGAQVEGNGGNKYMSMSVDKLLKAVPKEGSKSTGENQPKAAPQGASEKSKAVRLVPRDVVLMSHLGIARYLTAQQLHALVFPSCTSRVARRRIDLLSAPGGNGPYLANIRYRAATGPMVAYRLTEQGYATAQAHLGAELNVPLKDIGADFLAHTLELNNLYVGLLLPARTAPGRDGAQLDAAPARQPFRWINSESSRLPWLHYEPSVDGLQKKRIEPDAVLESAQLCRRWFLECEMGGHSITNPDQRSGSTIAKIRRYAEFYSGYADARAKETHYQRHYVDRWQAELVFLVPNVIRRDNLDAALAGWRREEGQLCTDKSNIALQVRAVTFADAQELFRQQLGLDLGVPARKNQLAVSLQELQRVLTFTAGLYDYFKAARGAARAAGTPEPEYPEGRDFIVELLERTGIRRRT
jgi:Replication-relaxation